MLGGHWDLAPCMERSSLIDFLKSGHTYVVELEDGTIVGNAVWSRPEQPTSKKRDRCYFLFKIPENVVFSQDATEDLEFFKFLSVLAQRDPDAVKWWNEYVGLHFESILLALST